MTEFKRLDDTVLVAGQITVDNLARAKDAGVGCIVNNRPDGEEPGQPEGDDIARAARDLGMDYRAIPVGQGGFGMPQVEQMADAIDSGTSVLAYCRTGTRSTFLWAMAQARAGADVDAVAQAALAAGYDIAPIRTMLDMLTSDGAA